MTVSICDDCSGDSPLSQVEADARVFEEDGVVAYQCPECNSQWEVPLEK